MAAPAAGPMVAASPAEAPAQAEPAPAQPKPAAKPAPAKPATRRLAQVGGVAPIRERLIVPAFAASPMASLAESVGGRRRLLEKKDKEDESESESEEASPMVVAPSPAGQPLAEKAA